MAPSPDRCSAIPGAPAASCGSAARRPSTRLRSPRPGTAAFRHATAISGGLPRPPADWLVLTRDYATQSGDTAALEPDNANGWYDAARQELHLVVPTQSPQEVAEGVATVMAK